MACESEQLAYDKALAKVAVWRAEKAVSLAEAQYAGLKLDQASEQLGRLRMKLDDCRNGCACTITEPDDTIEETLLSSLESTIEEMIVVRSDARAALDALG